MKFIRSSRREKALIFQDNRETHEIREKRKVENLSRISCVSRLSSKVRLLTAAATVLIALFFLPKPLGAQELKTNIRFEAVDIFVDSGARPLAAYQLEFRVGNGDAKIVGVEGGSHVAFREPPFYDPKAIQQERVILAAFNTSKADKLPKNKTRVATVHLQLSGSKEPEFTVQLKTAASVDGEKISAKATLERKEQ